jgi:hypothetical protein
MKITLDMVAELSTAIDRTLGVKADVAAAEIIIAAVAPLIAQEAAKEIGELRLRNAKEFGAAICKEGDLLDEIEAQVKEIAELRAALAQIAMVQTARTPEQAVQYFQYLARSLVTSEPQKAPRPGAS